MPKKFERILILSPHTDDGEVSAGGTISRLVEEGRQIYYIAFSSCEKSVAEGYPRNILKEECLRATKELGIPGENVFLLDYEVRIFPELRQEILESMIAYSKEIKPDLVLCPSSYDTHQDHHVIFTECVRAFKRTSSIWGMEHPWNNIRFRADILVELTQEQIEKKILALRNYGSQSFRDYFKEGFIWGCAYDRGMKTNVKCAEAFECIRMII